MLREQSFNVLGIFYDSIKPIRKRAAGIRRSLSRKCRKCDRCSWNLTARGDEEAVEIFQGSGFLMLALQTRIALLLRLKTRL